MAPFVVHSIAGSPFGRAVLAALEEKGAAYGLAPVAPGSLKSEPHLARHPFGRVPVLEHGDFRLYETQAILRYLDRVLPEPPLTPADARAAARMDQLMNLNDWYLFQGVGDVIGFQRVIAPMLLGLPSDVAACEAAMPRAQAVFQTLSRQLGDQPFLVGEALTLADLMIAPQLDVLSLTPEWAPLSAGRENLAEWLGRMRARPSFEATTYERLSALAA